MSQWLGELTFQLLLVPQITLQWQSNHDKPCCLLGARLSAQWFTWVSTAQAYRHALK